MVAMEVREDDDVDLVGLMAGCLHALAQLAEPVCAGAFT